MIIVLTPERSIEDETKLIHRLLENGLDMLHIRKHGLTEMELKNYLNKIKPGFHEKLVLHTYHYLAEPFGIKRLHFSTENRLKDQHLKFSKKYTISTSTHSIDEFNSLSDEWDYAFSSPVFSSISKQGYGSKKNVFDEFQNRKNYKVKLIGLGGITQNNASKVFEIGADGIALLGGVWQNKNPLKSYLACKQIAHSF